MKCPYCNYQCFPSFIPDNRYTCHHCPHRPRFKKWDDSGLGALNFIVAFKIDGYMKIYFAPNTGELTVPYINKVFKINVLITPDNVKSISERLIKMKVFL